MEYSCQPDVYRFTQRAFYIWLGGFGRRPADYLTAVPFFAGSVQIVPVKVKYFQLVPNETKNRLKTGIDSTGCNHDHSRKTS
jgi:hypothetical protein